MKVKLPYERHQAMHKTYVWPDVQSVSVVADEMVI